MKNKEHRRGNKTLWPKAGHWRGRWCPGASLVARKGWRGAPGARKNAGQRKRENNDYVILKYKDKGAGFAWVKEIRMLVSRCREMGMKKKRLMAKKQNSV